MRTPSILALIILTVSHFRSGLPASFKPHNAYAAQFNGGERFSCVIVYLTLCMSIRTTFPKFGAYR